MTSTMVAVDGGEVWAHDSGGAGAPLVLLHPGIGDSRFWEPVLPGFPWPEAPDSAEADEAEAAYERALAAGDVEGLTALAQRVWAAAGPTPAVMEQLRSASRAAIALGDLEQSDPPVFDRLGSISVPTSLLVGDADYPPLIEADRQAAARIPGCELTVVPGMDHLPTLREPDLVLATITRTLDRAATSP